MIVMARNSDLTKATNGELNKKTKCTYIDKTK